MSDEKTGSVHIHYAQTSQPYHKVAASLVAEHCKEDALILDIGSGLGHTLSCVKELLPKARLVAADIDSNCLDITGKRVELYGEIPLKDIEDLFETRRLYDAVIMSHVLEHMLRPADVVKSVMKLMRPGGILVLAVPNPVRPSVFLFALRRYNYVNKGHVCAWDRAHWINFLENILALNVVCYSQDFVQIPFFRRFRFFKPIEKYLAKIFPWLSFSNIAVIRK